MISAWPRHPLIAQPTPLEHLPRLSRHLGDVDIWIKRDDQTGLAFGGNKIRKLEFLAAEALVAGADTLVTIGGVQSNHCRQTAAVAAKLGLACHLLLVEGDKPFAGIGQGNGNVLLDHLLGATIRLLPASVDREAALAKTVAQLTAAGARPFAMPAGGSTAVGALGYVAAADEILDQCDAQGVRADLLVHSSGSGGTQAGLICGFSRSPHSPQVLGMSCGKPANVLAGIVDTLATETAAVSGYDPALLPKAQVDDRFIGPGYAIPRADTWVAIMILARLEGIFLDPVYSGKAMAGLIAGIQSGRLAAGSTVIFLHTGGAPALFAYPKDIGEMQ